MGTHSIAELQNHGRWDLETAPVGILWDPVGRAWVGQLWWAGIVSRLTRFGDKMREGMEC